MCRPVLLAHGPAHQEVHAGLHNRHVQLSSAVPSTFEARDVCRKFSVAELLLRTHPHLPPSPTFTLCLCSPQCPCSSCSRPTSCTRGLCPSYPARTFPRHSMTLSTRTKSTYVDWGAVRGKGAGLLPVNGVAADSPQSAYALLACSGERSEEQRHGGAVPVQDCALCVQLQRA